ncbi:type II toxin-antitoxin system HipA family toxin [Haloferula sp. A504]|uniref:type II toxin-antitoxin system HipA family toxin n=1 Tax=Haloferula sp. A504 TaxID=3373601 RepID=UPI0031C34132|nr:type II toxin-antitoxin system HipA family toxin [Verrucomicrobiaceae bacterium E54]
MKLTVRHLGIPEGPVIGRLFEAPDHRVFFEFDSEWAARGIELSPIYLPANTPGSVTTPTPAFGPLFGLFEDSMPDWWGTRLLKRFFDEKGIPWRRVGSLQKLAAQGDYGIGVLGYEPDEAPPDFRSEVAIDVADLVDTARRVYDGEPAEGITQLIRSGMTAGGAQPKALVHLSKDFATLWPGGGNPPEGSSPWLLKFQLDAEGMETREEHACHLMAAAAGIHVPETRLLTDARGRAHFLTRRFDRLDGQRFHVHTWCGLTHTSPGDGLDYADLMNLARMLCAEESAVDEFFLRAVFNVSVGNDDDHGRNHAFLMDSEHQWHPSPAYDLTFASNPLTSNLRSAAVNGRHAELKPDDLRRLGRDQSVRRIDEKIGRVIDVVRRWPEFAATAGLPEGHAARLATEMPTSRW